jgi:hypothetical protein
MAPTPASAREEEGIVRRLIALVATLVLATIATVAYAATPEVVLNDPAVNETSASASEGYLVWSANSEAKPNRYHSYVMAGAGSPVRIDPAGAQSYSAAIDGTTIVYQESTSEGEDLWFFDAITEVRSAPPAGVNTANVEYRPSLSGDRLLFTRTNVNRVSGLRGAWRKVVLFDVSTSTSIVLRKSPYRSTYLVSDQVNGDWATFESCGFRRGEFFDCQVFRYQISTEELVKIANPGVQQYAGAVSGNGTIYLVRAANDDHWVCGSHAKVVRYPVGGPGVVIATLPDGRDALTTFALDETGGSTTVYFDRLTCRDGRSGIYRIANAATVAP